MIASITSVRKEQIRKKRLLEREFSWIKHEFSDFHTTNDIELYNIERYIDIYLQPHFI